MELLLIGLVLYLLPSIIATARKHPNTLGILLLNILLGWTFLGFVAALVWAVANPRVDIAVTAAHPKAQVSASNSLGGSSKSISESTPRYRSVLKKLSLWGISGVLIYIAAYWLIQGNISRNPELSAENAGQEQSIVATVGSSATSPKSYTVSTSALNYRSCPSTSCSVIGTFKSGDRIEVVESELGWFKIEIDRTEAWVSSRYVTPFSDSESGKKQTPKIYGGNDSSTSSQQRDRNVGLRATENHGNIQTDSSDIESMAQCKYQINSLLASDEFSGRTETLVNTNLVYMVKIFADDGEVTATCSSLDRKLVVTRTLR